MILLRQASVSVGPIVIPATFGDGHLKLENNGISNVFFGSSPKEFTDYKAEAFQLFGRTNTPVERPFFISYDGITSIDEEGEISDDMLAVDHTIHTVPIFEMWELFYVYSKRKVEPDGSIKRKALEYSCLRMCREGTLFCKCEECGEHFVITPQTVKFYEDRNLVVPTIRCDKCIQKKKVSYIRKA